MDKEIHISNTNQKNEIKKLWDMCFGDSKAFTDWFFDEVYCPENTLVCTASDKVVSALQIFYYDVFCKGKRLRAGYLAGVSTHEQYRNHGLAAKLIKKADEVMIKNGCSIAMLIPFNFDFYRKYGYECIGYRAEYKGKVSQLKKFGRAEFTEKEYLNAPISDYNDFVKSKQMYLIRDEKFFCEMHTNITLDNGKITQFDDGGYIVWLIKDRELYAPEIAYKNIDELCKILSFIYSKMDSVDTFRIRTAADSALWSVLSEAGVTETRYPADMMKVFDKACAKDIYAAKDNYFNMLGWV